MNYKKAMLAILVAAATAPAPIALPMFLLSLLYFVISYGSLAGVRLAFGAEAIGFIWALPAAILGVILCVILSKFNLLKKCIVLTAGSILGMIDFYIAPNINALYFHMPLQPPYLNFQNFTFATFVALIIFFGMLSTCGLIGAYFAWHVLQNDTAQTAQSK